MYRITLDKYTLGISESIPSIFAEYRKHAQLVEEFESRDAEVSQTFFSVAKGADWPFLVITRKRSTGSDSGFHPGIVLIPETNMLFFGSEELVVAYDLDMLKKVWEESILLGFRGWERYKQFIVMSAEVEMVVWDIYGKKKWSTFVDPPWSYKLDNDAVYLESGGKNFSFSIASGPTSPTW